MLAVLYILILLITLACGDGGNDKLDHAQAAEVIDSTQIKKINYIQQRREELDNRFAKIDYHQIIIANSNDLANFKNKYSKDSNQINNKIIRTLNRKEFRFIRVGDTLIIPDKFDDNLLAYSVFPQFYPEAIDIAKIIIVSNAMQAYACYENGELVRFAAANTGKERTQTYPGKYYLEWRQRLRRSSLDSTWILPFTFNFHRLAGSALHQFEMPGRPVSHSCVRQFIEDAEWMYSWGKQAKYIEGKPIEQSGTPLLIIDHFNYERKKNGPWIDLTSNQDGIIKLPDNPLEYEDPFIPISQIPKESRGMLKNRQRYVYAEDSLRARGVLREGVSIIPSVNFNEVRRKKKAQLAKEEAEKQRLLKESSSKESESEELKSEEGI